MIPRRLARGFAGLVLFYRMCDPACGASQVEQGIVASKADLPADENAHESEARCKIPRVLQYLGSQLEPSKRGVLDERGATELKRGPSTGIASRMDRGIDGVETRNQLAVADPTHNHPPGVLRFDELDDHAKDRLIAA